MVVDTMTWDEIAQELQRERMNYSDIITWYDTSCKARRKLVKMPNKRSTTPIYFPPKYYTTPNRNTLLVTGHCYGFKQYSKSGLIYSVSMFFRYQGELWAGCWGIDETDNRTTTAFFSPHLFQRYKMRFLKDSSSTTQKAMEHFFSRNGTICISAQNNPDYHNGVVAVCQDGMLLGELSGTSIRYRTFVSDPMLKGNQIDLAIPQKDLVVNSFENQTPLCLCRNGDTVIRPLQLRVPIINRDNDIIRIRESNIIK